MKRALGLRAIHDRGRTYSRKTVACVRPPPTSARGATVLGTRAGYLRSFGRLAYGSIMVAPLTFAPLARMFRAFEQHGLSGEIVYAGEIVVRVGQGRVTGIAGVDAQPLGDLLRLQGGLLDESMARAQRMRRLRGTRVGALLVTDGLATGAAVARALGAQLEQRLHELVRRTPKLESVRVLPAAKPPAFSLHASAALWRATTRTLEALSESSLMALSGAEPLRLTDFGERWFAALDAPGAEQLPTRDARTEALASVQSGAELPRSLHSLRACLRALGLAERDTPRSQRGYALLARKRRELARGSAPAVLLELSSSERAARARAVRRFAALLHPDRFCRDHPGIHALAGDTLRALLDLEHAPERVGAPL